MNSKQLPFSLPMTIYCNTLILLLLASLPPCAFQVFVYSSVCSCMPPPLGWQFKEVMPSSLSRLGKLWRNQQICTQTEFHLRFCWRREFPHLLCPHHLSSSRGTEVSLVRVRICSEHCNDQNLPCQSPVNIQSSWKVDWKYVGIHIKIPTYDLLARKINSVATILCTTTWTCQRNLAMTRY